jgi:hypothetical protein
MLLCIVDASVLLVWGLVAVLRAGRARQRDRETIARLRRQLDCVDRSFRALDDWAQHLERELCHTLAHGVRHAEIEELMPRVVEEDECR